MKLCGCLFFLALIFIFIAKASSAGITEGVKKNTLHPSDNGIMGVNLLYGGMNNGLRSQGQNKYGGQKDGEQNDRKNSLKINQGGGAGGENHRSISSSKARHVSDPNHMSLQKDDSLFKQSYLKMVFYTKGGKNGGYTTTTYQMKGLFKNFVGHQFTVEGTLIKVNLDQFCNSSSFLRFRRPYVWIAFAYIPSKQHGKIKEREECMSLPSKLKYLTKYGARAVIISYEEDSVINKIKSAKVSNSVIMVTATETRRMRASIEKEKHFVRIKGQAVSTRKVSIIHRQKIKDSEYFDMGIFLAFFIIVSLICLILLIKLKWRQNRKKSFRVKVALEALGNMHIRKYHAPTSNDHVANQEQGPELKSSFGIKTCTVCLDELYGKDIRILPCFHEFHQECIDPWLIANFTCPLCMYSIIETKKLKNKRRRRIIPQFIVRKFHNSENQADPEAISIAEGLDPLLDSHQRSSNIVRTAQRTDQCQSTLQCQQQLPTHHQQRQTSKFYPTLHRNNEVDHANTSEYKTEHPQRFHRCPHHHIKRQLKVKGPSVCKSSESRICIPDTSYKTRNALLKQSILTNAHLNDVINKYDLSTSNLVFNKKQHHRNLGSRQKFPSRLQCQQNECSEFNNEILVCRHASKDVKILSSIVRIENAAEYTRQESL